ncbi:methylated-DNA--[protein]-cysteine S-methyltransferase [Eikenella sp. S3360]|uniref:Methylated-DNA--protein-cysteine methyltransferase n=2 Tax=Eikenella glucosivorans TaxID=2766967 RepID=A0ABS0N8N8_9NEIS|nr:methylated-DNA--[protein]-cysteine S-methyltransferase [Eikenella glucosivorans]
MIVLHTFPTPLGNMLAGASEHGLCLLEFAGSRRIESELRDLQHLLGSQSKIGENEHTRLATAQIGEYFRRERQSFNVPLHTPGSPFQRQVWAALQSIPYGETTHYQALAEALGKPAAVRAVAAANGANRVSILIPCHRVIGKDGSLTGYGGGLHRKQWLLDHEQGRHQVQPDLLS